VVTKPKKKGGGSLADRAKRNPALLRKALKNPGLRSKLPSSMLTPAQRGQRRFNTKQAGIRTKRQAKRRALKQPVVPGSTLTKGQLNKETQAELDVAYGPLESQQSQQTQEAQNFQRDIGGYYDQYLRQIAQQAANVRQIGAEANQAMQGLQGGITGLATQDLRDIQAPANADAAARGQVAGNQAPLASSAAAVRQGILGSQGTELANQNASASRYADTLANVVGPGQKLQAVAQAGGRVRQARQKQADTARERGAAGQKYRSGRRQEETKNVLAQQTLGGNLADKAADNAAAEAARKETKRSHKANERLSQRRINAQGQKVNKYGYTEKDWRKMSTGERRKIIAASGGGKGKGKDGKKGLDLLTPGQAGKGLSELEKLRDYASKARKGEPFVPGHGKQTPLKDRHAVDKKIRDSVAAPSNPILKTAVYDALFDKHLSPETVRGLHRAGYRVDDVTRILRTTTRKGWKPKRTRSQANTRAYGKTAPQPQGHA